MFYLKKFPFALCYAVLLTAFTVYVLLDTFVIARAYEKVENRDEASYSSETAVITDSSYSDENITINIKTYSLHDTTVYVADVQLSSAEYLKTALADDTFGKNITAKTSEIAEDHGAILAINGDFYGAQEHGIVLRNGVLYRDNVSRGQDDLVIYDDGSFGIVRESKADADELMENGAMHILSFGPVLVKDGEIAIDEDEEVDRAMRDNPRTAIGIIDELHYLFIVSDGRSEESKGLTLYELAELMEALDVDIGYNLDGGGSATMYFNGRVVNKPTTNGEDIRERWVSDIVYIG